MSTELTPREQVVEVLNRLCLYIDEKDYETMSRTLFTELVHVDLSCFGQEARVSPPEEICGNWKKSHAKLDAVVHRLVHPCIDFGDDSSSCSVVCYIHGTHYKDKADGGDTFDICGRWDMQLSLVDEKWRISSMKYTLKYTTGNISLA